MTSDHRSRLASIRRFDQLVAYLRDDMGWPIASDDFEELTFEYTPEELGIDAKNAAKIQEIKRLRPLVPSQPWGIFFVKFEPKRLPVVALRRILGQVALKKRASANKSERQAWVADDLLFVSNYGEGGERQIAFAHFAKPADGADLPTLKVLGWDNLDTPLHLDDVAEKLSQNLAWPDDPDDEAAWRTRWRGAFTLRHREVVTTSRELSIRLAELARAICDRIKTALAIETEKGPLTQLMKAFQTALVHDLDADGFADMYAQTIAYGLLSARIADPHRKTADDFAAHMRTNPFLRELMETFLKVGGRRGKAGSPGIDFDELGVSEVIELLDDANMEAVVRDFGDRNPQEDPVIHFYELFLKEYDAKMRVQRGVFYTPRPVVSYIVRSVDELLRTEFGLTDGLADTTTWGEMAKRHGDLKIPEGVSPDQDFVQVIDPATGTGTFLVEVIHLIHKTLVAKWKAQGYREKKIDALWNEYVPKHLLARLHGYELLMAPYAIAHLKIGLKLYETGYRFGSDERARVYLTNALEPASDADKQMRFREWLPALAHEAEAVNRVKKNQRFTVVVGNPPYSGVSSNRNAWIEGLLRGQHPDGAADYYSVDGESLGEKKLWLQDDYVKFIRLSHYLLAKSSLGIHGMITNHSYLDSPTCRAMRFQLLNFFSAYSALDLHGSTKRGETPPGGLADENVFDILPGVAICVAVASATRRRPVAGVVKSHDLWGLRSSKLAWMMEHTVNSTSWSDPQPSAPYYLFVERSIGFQSEYEQYLSLREIFPFYGTGIQTSRDEFAVDVDRQELEGRLKRFFDRSLSDRTIAQEYGLSDTRGWKLHDVRRSSGFERVRASIVPVFFRTFDRRWVPLTKDIVDWPRLEVMACVARGRPGLLCSRQQAVSGFRHVLVVNEPADMFCLSNRSREGQTLFPLFVQRGGDLFGTAAGTVRPNIGPKAARLFEAAGVVQSQASVGHRTLPDSHARLVMNYVYGVLYSERYRERYADLLKMDYPRVPVPVNADLWRRLVLLGDELVSLHLFESPKLDRPVTDYLGGRAPEVEKISWSKNTVWLDKAQTTGFRGVREDIWSFHIGGYQVCEKWLKDRKGRTLSKDDIAHYQKIVVALSETIRLMKEIDEVIEQHGGWPGAFQTGASAEAEKQALLKIAEPRTAYGVEKGRDERRK